MQFSSTEDFWNVTRPIGRARIKMFLLHLRMYRTTILRFKFAFTFLLFDLFSSNYECTSYCTKILFDPISSICTLLCIARYCIWGFRNFDSSLCTFYTTLLPDEQLVLQYKTLHFSIDPRIFDAEFSRGSPADEKVSNF